jgi:polyhydroxyalkanoate synthase subunit PhaC
VRAPSQQPTTVGPVDVEAFSRNLARIIEEGGRALAAYMKPRDDGRNGEMADELREIVKTLGEVLQYWLSDPQRTAELQSRLGRSYLELWGTAVKRLSGEAAPAVATPAANDKRFSDSEWTTNQFYDFLKQLYLLTVDWANRLVSDADKLDRHTRHKAEFYIRQIANALSPSNFVLTNPELLRETLTSNAENLVRGMHMLAEDVEAGGGYLKIRQSDTSMFAVGRNLATTPGKVIFQNDIMQLLQFAPSTEKVLKRPVLIVPPWINKYYVLDLAPEKSFIKWCVDQGITVFCVSWVNPDERLAQKTFEDYIREGPLAALDAIKQATGEDKVNAVGYCVGGTMLAVALAKMAVDGDERIASATLFAAQVDFTYAGDLKVFIDEAQVEAIEQRMAERGYLEGGSMVAVFNLLRSNDLIWPYVINNYLRGKAPFPFDLLYWNSDATRLPAANHSFYMRNCYLDNTITKGKMVIGNTPIDLKTVKVPIYNLATREDHIAPAKSVLLGCKYFGGRVRYVLSGSGHIAGVVNPPTKQKYQYWTGPRPRSANLDGWLKKAKENPGSWWPDWLTWLKRHDATEAPARVPGDGALTPIEDAPGSYVKVQA